MISADPMTLPEAQRALQTARAVLAHPNTPAQNKTIRRMWEYFDWYEQLVLGTPFEVATPRQARQMRKALQVQLPKLVRTCAVLLAQNSAAAARKKLVARTPDQIFRRVYWRRFGKQLDTIAQLGVAPTLTATPAKQMLPQGETLPVFPILTAVNSQVDTALKQLRIDWERAASLPTLTTEDRFLLEQMAKVYLPDSWRLYGEAQRLHADVREQAAGMLFTQVQALQGELEVLLNRGGDDVLTRLSAQTRFIQQKSQPHQETELDLRSDITSKDPSDETN